ncbi:hypothetical protein BsIDN1_30440 [Bacillus safensis]|uniref:Uncharacterized protein n=1 Tax=Bacillus safensis TaxID=561879 RepID=A0A5S9MD23_BACIA|nr:hypothetical protein BsIDN1_30440 [Bacillus safensis]
MYDKYFQTIGSGKQGNPYPGNGKGACHYLMAWYTSWGGGLGEYANWSWRIGASHCHQGYQNPVAAYALSSDKGGLKPSSATGASDWEKTLKRQLEFYVWLQSKEGAIAGGATNSWNGDYSAYPAGRSTFMIWHMKMHLFTLTRLQITGFGMQAWPMERVAELYYIFVKDGDKTSENVQMAKSVITKWVSYALDYIFIGSRPVSDEEGYFLDEQGQRILGGTNVFRLLQQVRLESFGFLEILLGADSLILGMGSSLQQEIQI